MNKGDKIMTITMHYTIYKDLIEKCTFFDDKGNQIQVNQIDYNKKYNTITLEFVKQPTKAIIK
jgi:hypothetical protein